MDAPSTRLIETLLAREDATGARHVLWEGRVEEMVGGTAAHYRLSVQLLFQFMSELGEAFDTFSADTRLAVPAAAGLVYPDVAVARDARFGKPVDTLLNPLVICEVLSNSTEAFDRGDKFRAYRALESLQHYVLVSQSAPCVEVFTRSRSGKWPVKKYGLGERASLGALQMEFDVSALYKRVTFKRDA